MSARGRDGGVTANGNSVPLCGEERDLKSVMTVMQPYTHTTATSRTLKGHDVM